MTVTEHLTDESALIDSRFAARRLITILGISILGNCGMWVLSVVLPVIQHEFGVTRAQASLPYTVTLLAFGIGGIYLGRVADRWGINRVVHIGALGVSSGFVLSALSPNIWLFCLAHGLLIGFLGIASSFVPLMADTSRWWNKYRGIAVAICASGNYLAGTFWSPIIQYGINLVGWRTTYICIGIACGIGMWLLNRLIRHPPPALAPEADTHFGQVIDRTRPFGLSPNVAQWALFVAGIGCCVAMAMPQVHLVAYCMQLGLTPLQGANMLSLMLGLGVVSRLLFGWVSDHIGGLKTLIVSSGLQGLALALFLPFDGVVALYVIAGLFGLFQGGIVPAYAIVIRAYFPIEKVGGRIGTVIFGTLIGMAFGGWMSGKLFDLTGTYAAAFWNGIAWNLLNLTICIWLYSRTKRSPTLGGQFKPGAIQFGREQRR
jgi:MFS family permease